MTYLILYLLSTVYQISRCSDEHNNHLSAVTDTNNAIKHRKAEGHKSTISVILHEQLQKANSLFRNSYVQVEKLGFKQNKFQTNHFLKSVLASDNALHCHKTLLFFCLVVCFLEVPVVL